MGSPGPGLAGRLALYPRALPAACRWLPGATAGRQRAARTTSGGRWAAGRGTWVVGGSLGGRSGREGRPLAGPRASGGTGAHRAPGAEGGADNPVLLSYLVFVQAWQAKRSKSLLMSHTVSIFAGILIPSLPFELKSRPL